MPRQPPLLEDLVERGVDPKRRYLFVIDGYKALQATTKSETFATSCRMTWQIR